MEWTQLKEATYQAAADTVGVRMRVLCDWFDENDAEVISVLDDLRVCTKHLDWIRDKNSSVKKKCLVLLRFSFFSFDRFRFDFIANDSILI